jgi:hypothetical protein
MSIRFSRFATGMLVFAALVLTTGVSWAVFHQLPQSKDEWGLKYDVAVDDAGSDKVTVKFTLADEGRLKPIYSIEVIAFSRPDATGGRTYLAKERFEFKPNKDGVREGQVQIPKKLAEGAIIRFLTLTVEGRRQTAGAAYHDIQLKKYLNGAPTVATPPAKNVTK